MKKVKSLWGEWQFELDNDKLGIAKHFESKTFSDSIKLPTTTSEARKGEPNEEALSGSLTLKFKTAGYAWFRKEIEFDSEDFGKPIHLFLERTRISHVWIDDSYVGTQDSLSTSHSYDLTPFIKNKSHNLTIMTSNTDYPINGGHLTSPDTQTNWNGILGKIDLIVYDQVYIKSVKTSTRYNKKAVSLEIKTINNTKSPLDLDLAVVPVLLTKKPDEPAKNEDSLREEIQLLPGENIIKTEYQFTNQVKYWDEFDPNLYEITITLNSKNDADTYDRKEVHFGMHNLKGENNHFTINGTTTFLRGKHDGLVFPLTGYAPMDAHEWEKVLLTAKEYGINHYRFHTCCPPEAAFIAADKVGIYFSPELPFWGSFYNKENEKYEEKVQNYLEEEGYRILDAFGNHPSFTMFSLGNELWGDQDAVDELLGKFKNYDNRRLYTQGSNNFQFVPRILSNDDYFVGVRFAKFRLFRGSYAMCDAPLGFLQTDRPANNHDYDEIIIPQNVEGSDSSNAAGKEIEIQYETTVKKVTVDSSVEEVIPKVPVISHEIGQYTFYPDFHEIEKYSGVLEARNFMIFRDRLKEKNLLHLADKFFKAAGLFAVECYKAELEAAIRSKELAGFHILDLQDFPGQGTALVGILNAFMENKGLVSAKEWRSFCSSATVQALLPKYVFASKETFELPFILCNYSKESFQHNINLHYTLTANSKCYLEGTLQNITAITSGVNHIGVETIMIPDSKTPLKLTLTIRMEGTNISNSYDLYTYPVLNQLPESGYTNDVTEALVLAADGKSVLLLTDTESNPNSIEGTYCTDFWCFPMFRSISESMNRPIPVGTLGLLIDNEHPALAGYPSEIYSTPSWWEIVMNSRSTILDNTGITPIVQTIDNFERNHRLGLIYEVNLKDSKNRAGKILVCTAPLNKLDRAASPEINWLLKSLTDYSASIHFNPDYAMTSEEFAALFEKKQNRNIL